MENVRTKYEVKKEGTKQLFKNRFLEKLTNTHVAVPLVIFYSIALGLIVYSIFSTHLSGWTVAGMFWIGLFLWTLFEYVMHRELFHIEGESKWITRLQYLLHGVHHEYPRDKKRLVMPPTMSIVLATLFVLLFQAILGEMGFAFGAGFLAGYATYLSIHYATHVFKPPKGFFKRWWVNHAIHHFTDDTVAFGVSTPIWDYIFRTMPKRKKARS